jgi:hypothetical protein
LSKTFSLDQVNHLVVKRLEIDVEQYKLRNAEEDDYARLVSEPFCLYDEADPETLLAAYIPLEEYATPQQHAHLEAMRVAMGQITYLNDQRPGGLRSKASVLGYVPRNVLRHDFCNVAAMAYNRPKQHAVIVGGSVIIDEWYRRLNPSLRARHMQIAEEKVSKEYRLSQVPFTSGIVNNNNPLMYHFDSGNFENVWSGQIVLRRYAEGGYLALPEFGIAVACSDKSLFLFDGQGIVHGVTPIRLTRKNGRRYSIVYYSLKGLWHCEPFGVELERIKRVRTDREDRRAAGKL